jgi:hypothetical protein
MKLRYLMVGLLVFGCTSLPYKDDAGYLNSAQAGSYEFPVSVNGKPCKDMDGVLGACTKQIKNDQALVVDLPERPYAYRLDIQCSMPLGVSFPVDVQKNSPYRLEIKPEAFADLISWTCKGEVFPYDRDQAVSAMWQVRVLVRDPAYQGREKIYTKDGKVIVLGAHAKYSDICDSRGCRQEKEKTVAGYKGSVKAISESEVMRFNTFGW